MDISPEDIADLVAGGELPAQETLLGWLGGKLRAPAEKLIRLGAGVLPVLLLLVLLRAMLPQNGGCADAVVLLIRMHISLYFADAIREIILQGVRCLETAAEFSNVLSPVLATLMTGAGMPAASALISPAAALSVGVIENIFLKYGIPLCRLGLCCALAGNLSKAISLRPVYRLLRKALSWGSGLVIAVFTAILSLQSGAALHSDSLALRTAKYAVDSAGGIIGSGIGDAWDTYISGIAIARRTVGLSGILILIGASLVPVAYAAGCMLMLKLFSAAAGIFGEKETANLAEDLSGICQMTVSLVVGGMAAVTILITAAMGMGSSIAG